MRPLVHGSTYFAELYERLEATRAGDLVFFTDWQGDADERLTGEPGSEVAEVLGRADERGVDVRGLVWRSHSERDRASPPTRTCTWAGSCSAVASRRSSTCGSASAARTTRSWSSSGTATTRPATSPTSAASTCATRAATTPTTAATRRRRRTWPAEYGDTPPWHDIQAAITGPAVHDVETVFRERWEDPTTLRRSPIDPAARPAARPRHDARPAARAGAATAAGRRRPATSSSCSAPTRTCGRAATTRSRAAASGASPAATPRPSGTGSSPRLRRGPVPLGPPRRQRLHRGAARPPRSPRDRRGAAAPGRRGVQPHRPAPRPAPGHARHDRRRPGPGGRLRHREPRRACPVYVHAKTCLVDDTWATIGSDNFNRRSWTHDSELSAVVLDPEREYARDLRLALAAEHLDRDPGAPWTTASTVPGCSRPTPPARRPSTGGTPTAGSGRDHPAGCAGSSRPGSAG